MFKDKDFLIVEYTGRIKDTGEVIDTTSEEEAKKANIYDSDRRYVPQLVILGEHRLIKGLEEALYSLDPDQEKEVEIPPENAYGTRDPSKVKIVSLGELRKQGITPYPNMPVRFSDGTYGTVKSVTGGRVLIDMNHPLAGRSLIYKIKVVKVLNDEKEKIDALLDRWFSRKYMPAFELSEDKKSLKVTIPKELFLLEDLQTRKLLFARDVITYVLPEDCSIIYQEIYNKSIFTQ